MATEVDELIESVNALLGSSAKPQSATAGQRSVEAALAASESVLSETAELLAQPVHRSAEASPFADLFRSGVAVNRERKISDMLAEEIQGGNNLHKTVADMSSRELHNLLYKTGIRDFANANQHRVNEETVSAQNALGHSPLDVARRGLDLAVKYEDERAQAGFGRIIRMLETYMTPKLTGQAKTAASISRGRQVA